MPSPVREAPGRTRVAGRGGAGRLLGLLGLLAAPAAAEETVGRAVGFTTGPLGARGGLQTPAPAGPGPARRRGTGRKIASVATDESGQG